MTNNPDKFDPPSFFIGIFISGIICLLIGIFAFTQENGYWKRDAIKTGNAKYNEKTSSFEWIDHSVPSERLSEKDE